MIAPLFLTVSAVSLLIASADAAVKPFITTQAEYNTECKTCPRSLCPNKVVYPDDQDSPFNVTCWTRGTKIMGDRLWLKTDAGCYITQYDVLEYEGDYTTDLAYCGRQSEEQNLTIEENSIKYKAECRICPELTCDNISYLKEETDVDITCWYPEGQIVIDDPYWMKTTNNCYVSRKHLSKPPNLTYLDNCGPVPLLEPEKHNNENGTSDINKRDAKPSTFGTMYLINVTVGEEYAYCRSCPKTTCKSQKRFEFNQEVWLQCVTNQEGVNGTTQWWSQTTDFCYVQNSDFWESPEGDYYKMPSCDRFETPDGSPGGDDDDDE